MLHPLPAPQLPRPARITHIVQENARTITLTLDLRWQAQPGQFLMAWLPRFDEKPFSLVNDDPVTIMVTRVGPFTTLVHGLKPGDRLWVRGPLGRGFRPVGRSLLAAAGGYGVAPLAFLARRLSPDQRLTTVIGARTAADLLYAETLKALGSRVILVTEDGSVGETGLVTDPIGRLLDARAFDALFACGPNGMLRALQALAQRYHLPAQLSWEAYMRCGVGLCGSCVHEDRLLCLDGPVLQVDGGIREQ